MLSARCAPEHFPATKEERRGHHTRVLRELQLSKKSLQQFLSEWFRGCDPKEIKFDNVMEWAAQNMFSKHLRECSKDELDELRYVRVRASA